MDSAEKYNRELERLLDLTQAKSDRAGSARVDDFLARAKRAKLTPTQMMKLHSAGGFDSIFKELDRREKLAKSTKPHTR